MLGGGHVFILVLLLLATFFPIEIRMLNWLNLYLSLTFLTAKAGFGVADFAVIVDRDDR